MRKMILAALFLVAAFALPLTAAGPGHNELYVNAISGSDTGLCQSASSACRTIQAAIDQIPIVLDRHFTVYIAPGNYPESLMIADRLAPKGHEIRIVGLDSGARLNGMKTMEKGILIKNSPRVVLQNLEITGFTEVGVLVQHAEALLTNTRVVWNLSEGVVCEYGDLVIETGSPARSVSLLNNAGSGLTAESCHVRFDGPATIAENGIGLLSSHGGLIDLAARTDVIVTNNSPQPPAGGTGSVGGVSGIGGEGPRRHAGSYAEIELLCQLVADCHGMITGYEKAQIAGGCVCASQDYGVCHP